MAHASQHPRTTADLINELEAEAAHHTEVALAVGFENTSLFIISGEDHNLSNLNEMVTEGGEPVGFLAYDSDGNGHLTFKCRPLKEYADEPRVQDYLEKLTDSFLDLVRRHVAA